MSESLLVELELPTDLARLQFPTALDKRLQTLLDKQGQGETLTDQERQEAESLVELAEMLTLLKLRAQQASLHHSPDAS